MPGPPFRTLYAARSGGVERKDHAFTVETVVLHVRTMLARLLRLEQLGYSLHRPRVEVLVSAEKRQLGSRIADVLNTDIQPLEHPYYSGGLRYRIWVSLPDGGELPLADGGAFDWLGQLSSNRRAVFIGSGLGSQLIALRFARQAPP